MSEKKQPGFYNYAEKLPDDSGESQEPPNAPEYSPEDLEDIAGVADAAADMLVQGVQSGDCAVGITETPEGVRGYVKGESSGGRFEGFFEGVTLSRVNLIIGGDESEHVITIVSPESANPQLLLDGQPADPEDIPGALTVVEAIRDAAIEGSPEEAADDSGVDGEDVAKPAA